MPFSLLLLQAATPSANSFLSGFLPIILMLAQPRRNVVDRVVGLGVNEVIAKPFSPKTLWSRLDEIINTEGAPR